MYQEEMSLQLLFFFSSLSFMYLAIPQVMFLMLVKFRI